MTPVYDYLTDEDSNSSSDDSEYEDDHEEQFDEVDNVHVTVMEYYVPPRQGEYKLGLVTLDINRKDFVLMTSVDTRTYYKFPHSTVTRYLMEYSLVYIMNPRLDILKMRLFVDNYNRIGHYCIIKTHYLRLVQRNWRRILNERAQMWKKRMNPLSMRCRQITGKWPCILRNLPGIRGMLWKLNKKNTTNSTKKLTA